jgi:hypothetical protein
MPIDYFLLPEMQEKFTTFRISSFEIGKIVYYFYLATFVEDGIETRILSSNFNRHVKD